MESDNMKEIIDRLATSTRSPRGKYAAKESWKLLEQRIHPHVAKRRMQIRMALSVAASLLLLFVGYSVARYMYDTSVQTVSTQAGVLEITLPDSSKVMLNRYSSLSYPRRFRKKQRNVSLSGEAYFEVEKNPEYPFVLNAGSVSVKVLGTHFNVESYPGDGIVRTTLLEGSVSVESPSGNLLLVPNESAVFNNQTGAFRRETVEPEEEVMAWRTGKLVFNNLPLGEIARRLGNAFHVKIEVKSEALKEFRIRAEFSRGESLTEILRMLSKSGNFYCTQEKGVIVIWEK